MKFAAILFAITIALAGSEPSVTSAAEKTLSAGHWRGRGHIGGGIAKKNVTAKSLGLANFAIDLYVSEAGAVNGVLAVAGEGSSNVSGKGIGYLTYHSLGGGFAASGTASAVEFIGNSQFEGTFVIAQLPQPVDVPPFVVPSKVTMHFATVTCGAATGDLAQDARKVQTINGFSTSVRAPFVLTRVGKDELESGGKDMGNSIAWYHALDTLEVFALKHFAGATRDKVTAAIADGQKAREELEHANLCGGKSEAEPSLDGWLKDAIAGARGWLKTHP